MTTLFEKYRPRQWSEVVGQDKAVRKLQAISERSGFGGRAYWLSGQSGTGKTTIAKIIADHVADSYATWEFTGREMTAKQIDELTKQTRCRPIGDKGGWAIVVNESHGLGRAAIERLLDALESIPPYCCWIFTTTNDGQDRLFDDHIDAHPLLSRCLCIPMAQRDLCKAFAARAQQIAQKEGLNGQPIAKYERLVKEHRQNLRAVLQAIEAGAMTEGGAT